MSWAAGGWWLPASGVAGETPEGVVRTLVVTDVAHTRRRLNRRLAEDERFDPLACVPSDPGTVIRHIDRLRIELVVIDGDSGSHTASLASTIRDETGAKVAIYAQDASRIDFYSSKADLRVSKSSGKRLLNDCYELFGPDEASLTDEAETRDSKAE